MIPKLIWTLEKAKKEIQNPPKKNIIIETQTINKEIAKTILELQTKLPIIGVKSSFSQWYKGKTKKVKDRSFQITHIKDLLEKISYYIITVDVEKSDEKKIEEYNTSAKTLSKKTEQIFMTYEVTLSEDMQKNEMVHQQIKDDPYNKILYVAPSKIDKNLVQQIKDFIDNDIFLRKWADTRNIPFCFLEGYHEHIIEIREKDKTTTQLPKDCEHCIMADLCNKMFFLQKDQTVHPLKECRNVESIRNLREEINKSE